MCSTAHEQAKMEHSKNKHVSLFGISACLMHRQQSRFFFVSSLLEKMVPFVPFRFGGIPSEQSPLILNFQFPRFQAILSRPHRTPNQQQTYHQPLPPLQPNPPNAVTVETIPSSIPPSSSFTVHTTTTTTSFLLGSPRFRAQSQLGTSHSMF